MAGADVATTAGGSVLTGALSGLMVMVMLVGVEQSCPAHPGSQKHELTFEQTPCPEQSSATLLLGHLARSTYG